MVTVVDFLAQAIKNKPTDGTDCQTLEAAQKELGRLRRITGKVVKVLNEAKELTAQNINGASVAPLPPQDPSSNGVGNNNTNGTSSKGWAKARAIVGVQRLKKRSKFRHRNALTIDQTFKTYKKITVEKSSEERALLKSAIKGNAIFAEFAYTDLDEFIDVFAPQKVTAGTTVFEQGDTTGDTFYVVGSGSLDIFINTGEGENKTEKQVGVPYRRGGAFGELALLYESPRTATIRASEDSDLWVITRQAFKGLQLQIEKDAHQKKLNQIKIVKIGDKVLSDVMDVGQIESMAMVTENQHFEAGETIVREGEKGNIFYMITRGEVDIYKKEYGPKKICTLGANSFFGEKALTTADTRQATCIAAKNTDCLTLTRDDFVLMLGNFQDLLSGKRQMSLKQSGVATAASFFERKESDSILKLKDLKIRRILGEGAFGKVALVKNKHDGKLYALKAQGKANVVENDFKEKLITEYRMMRELCHPFIVQCHQAMQDRKYIYFLMGLLPGGEILDLLDQYDKFPESWTRFYCGTVIVVFEYLHQQKIAYRDLKPENLVLDETGYCHVVDFGLAKRCNGKTWTTCGTPDYLAPEIVTGKGHDWGVDYWALGVLIYEMTYGWPPFYDENPTNTARKVIRSQYTMPPEFSRKLVDLISKLLTPQAQRLGRTRGGCRQIRKHPWFEDFNWQRLIDKKMKAPYKPEIGNVEKLGYNLDEVKWDAPDCDWVADLGARRESLAKSALDVEKELPKLTRQ